MGRACFLSPRQRLSSALYLSLSGEYWVDPNEGDIKDAIVVHCDMEHKATCVLPQPSMTDEFNWVGRSSGLVWLGEDIKPNFEVCVGDGSYVI